MVFHSPQANGDARSGVVSGGSEAILRFSAILFAEISSILYLYDWVPQPNRYRHRAEANRICNFLHPVFHSNKLHLIALKSVETWSIKFILVVIITK